MGTGLYIIDAIILVIIILPFILFINGSKKKQRTIRKALKAIAADNNCMLSKTESLNNFAIGLDTASGKIFFYKKNNNKSSSKIINLSSVSSCQVIKDTRRIKDKTNGYDLVNSVSLSFTHNNNQKESLELFNNNTETSLSGELDVANKWQTYIEELLKVKIVNEQQSDTTELNLA
ncbi:hypothetical protein [Winogradskyella wichelsiae]